MSGVTQYLPFCDGLSEMSQDIWVASASSLLWTMPHGPWVRTCLSLQDPASRSLGEASGSETVGQVVILLPVFRWTSTLFPTMAVPFYVDAITMYQGSDFSASSPRCDTFCSFDSGHPTTYGVCGDISLWFWFVFLSRLVMLSFFMCSLAVCIVELLWGTVFSVPCPLFNQDSLLLLGCRCSLHPLDINPGRIHNLKILSFIP